jgi:sugar phosphate permease
VNASPPSATLSRIDRLGVCLSLACAVQCLATPLLFTVLPLAGLGFFIEGPLEMIFLAAAMAMATGGLCWGFRVHRHRGVFGVLAAAAAMILLGQLVLDESYELAFVVIGTAILAGGHLLNRALCRACRRCQDEDTHAAG